MKPIIPILLFSTTALFGATMSPIGIDSTGQYAILQNNDSIENVPSRLASIKNVDAKATGSTVIYTVPAGKTAIITGAVIRCSAASAITIGPTLGIGVATNEDDIFASTALTTVTTTAKIYNFSASGASVSAAAASVIKVGIDAGATGTSQTISVDLLGYLL